MRLLGAEMQTLRIIATYFRLGALGELEYRANFFTQILQSVLSLAVGLGGLYVVFDHTDELGGWRPAELIALIGIFTLMGGLIRLVIQPSMQRFMEDIRQGTLDFKLTKPADAQLLVSVQQFQIWQAVDILLGLIILGVAAVRLGGLVGGWQALGLRRGPAVRRGYRLQLLAHPGHAQFLGGAGGEYPGHFPVDVRGRPLAGEHLPAVAALGADLPGAGGLRRDGAGVGLRRPADPADVIGGGGAGGGAAGGRAVVLADRDQALFGGFGVGARPVTARLRDPSWPARACGRRR
jgi:hypothetical protein